MTASAPAVRPLLTLEGVTARIRDRHLLPGTFWTLRAGQSWAVVGPNGSGKSTLAGLLLGVVPAVAGKMVRHVPDARPERIGHVSFELLERMAAQEARRDAARQFSGRADRKTTAGEVLFPAGADPAAADRFRREAVRWGADRFVDRPMASLSSGEMRRLLIARALAPRPALLVLDEPFEGLDAAAARLLRETISEIIAEGRVVVLATHLIDSLVPGISHAIFLKDGRVLRQGPFRQVLSSPDAAALFAGPRSGLHAAGRQRRHPDPGPPLIEMKRVCVSYRGVRVLENIDWTVRRGEHWALVGPNGAGKTTLLSMIAGDHPQAYANRVRLFGRRRGSGESIWEIKRRISLISPELQARYRKPVSALAAVLSGFTDTVGWYRRASEAERAEARRWLAFVGLDCRAEDRFDRLSYGERRRVLLARCMVKSPDILILDEPCQGLDPAMRRRFLTLVDRIGRGRRPSILYVTHRPEEIPSCIDRIHRLAPPTRSAAPQGPQAASCKTRRHGR